jgi:hypothetical protein
MRIAGLAVLVTVAVCPVSAQIERVSATDAEIVLRLAAPASQTIAVHAAAIHESNEAALARDAVWSGTVDGESLILPRYNGPVDRLYLRFLIVDGNNRPVGTPKYVTDLSELTVTAGTLPQPTSPKGLQCIVDLDDAIALGVKHAAINVSLSQLYDASGRSEIRRDVDGETVAAQVDVVARLDATVRRMTAAGIRVSLILLNYQSPRRTPSPLVHPATLSDTPNGIGAFNLTDAAGVRTYRGLIEILAERYSRADAANGLVANYIVGNEVQSHHDWYNMGESSPEAVVADYAKAVRVADLAVRRFHPDARACVSLDHNWSRQHRSESTRSMPGRVLFDRLHAALATQGDIPWAVAFHPYPEDLGDPRFWQDETAKLSFDTPRITFKNIEVLTAYLKQQRFQIDGAPRRLILSEQGFHCRSGDDGETQQAAAYAAAYERVRHIPGIESFIYHRHVDHPGEGGLRLGLRENVPGTNDQPGDSRPIAEVFRTIDTPDGPAATAFALPIVGVENWDELAPREVVDD